MDFRSLYTTYAPRIYRLCLGYVNDHEMANDLVQETFIAVWENLASFRNEAHPGTWIYRIATNKCLRHMEQERRQQKLNWPAETATVHAVDEQPDEKQAFLRQCIARLPETDRLIIGMYMEDIPQEEIATIIGLSHTNVRVRIHRIKERLSKDFKTYGKF